MTMTWQEKALNHILEDDWVWSRRKSRDPLVYKLLLHNVCQCALTPMGTSVICRNIVITSNGSFRSGWWHIACFVNPQAKDHIQGEDPCFCSYRLFLMFKFCFIQIEYKRISSNITLHQLVIISILKWLSHVLWSFVVNIVSTTSPYHSNSAWGYMHTHILYSTHTNSNAELQQLAV